MRNSPVRFNCAIHFQYYLVYNCRCYRHFYWYKTPKSTRCVRPVNFPFVIRYTETDRHGKQRLVTNVMKNFQK